MTRRVRLVAVVAVVSFAAFPAVARSQFIRDDFNTGYERAAEQADCPGVLAGLQGEVESRERGTIVSMGTYRLGGFGHIRADSGDTVAMFYWSLISGFHTLRMGQRVEFSRARYGSNRTIATLVEPVSDADVGDHEGR